MNERDRPSRYTVADLDRMRTESPATYRKLTAENPGLLAWHAWYDEAPAYCDLLDGDERPPLPLRGLAISIIITAMALGLCLMILGAELGLWTVPWWRAGQ